MGTPTVLYIGGAGRSGSTYLERVLSLSVDCVCVGEVRWIWDRGVGEDQLCSCGVRFSLCPFWIQVFQVAFGGFDTPEVQRLGSDQAAVDRLRYIPWLFFAGLRPRGFRSRLDEQEQFLAKLYAAIARVADRPIVVDSSKDPSYAYLLHANQTLGFRVLHMVRDSRAVAFSWSRHKLRPEIPGKSEYMVTFSPVRAAVIWLTANALMSILRRKVALGTLLKYETYANNPEAISDACRRLEITPPTGLDTNAGRFVPWHSVSGNPVRFSSDARIRFDDAWQRQMATRPFLIVTVISFPLLRAYGYVLSPLMARRRGKRSPCADTSRDWL
jgi:hypothetical protein